MQVMNFSSTDCKNCYKCVRTCALKAIEVKDDQAHIVAERCIACGHCLIDCPQNARDVQHHLETVKAAIAAGKEVVATLAPSYKAYFEEAGKFIAALRGMGISRIEETAIGAELVSACYEKYITESQATEFITTCCPSTVSLIETYYEDLIPKMVPVVSPMVAHGRLIKEQRPEAFTVFIGPCISKIGESLEANVKDAIDAVLTFDEVTEYLTACGVDMATLVPQEADACGTLRGKKYPVVGGVLYGIRPILAAKDLDVLRVHGMEESKAALTALREGKLKNVCVEISICKESCLAGPGGVNQPGNVFTRLQAMNRVVREAKRMPQSELITIAEDKLNRQFKSKQVKIHTATEEEITQVLRKMGKVHKTDELNCGACGYKTCREQAIAVINGMSHIEMCLPYNRNIAERLSNEIFANSPNCILLIDNQCKLIEMNQTAEEKFGCTSESLKDQEVDSFLPAEIFKEALKTHKSFPKEKVNLERYGLIMYRDVIYLEKQDALLVIFADITPEEKRKQEMSKLKRSTIDVTQTIIDKQMRVAQEIASLLGETTAETKVAIMKLRDVLREEGEY